MKEIIGREIDLSGLVQIRSEKHDSSFSAINITQPVKLILYLDSLSCSVCAIDKLGQYDFFQTKSNDSKDKFILMFVLSVPKKDIGYVVNYVINRNFEYPIYLDNENIFRTNNDFILKNKRFHSFLLDKNNKIILVGNPVLSDSMWKLYVKTIDSLIEQQ